jgi:hypothetical protein
MRVAVVFFGQPRFVNSHISAWSHKIRLRNLNWIPVGHVWSVKKNEVFQTAPWSGLGDLKTTNNEVDVIRKDYPGIELSVEPQRFFEVPQKDILLQTAKQNTTNSGYVLELNSLPNTVSQLYSIHCALGIARKVHEKQKLDLIVLTRYDTLIWKYPKFSKLPLDKLTVSNHHGVGFPDLIFAGPPDLIFSLDSYPYLSEFLNEAPKPTAEMFKQRAFLKSHSFDDINFVSTYVSILRSSNKFYSFVYLPLQRLKVIIRLRIRIKNAIINVRKISFFFNSSEIN